jgi:hypothetical protein
LGFVALHEGNFGGLSCCVRADDACDVVDFNCHGEKLAILPAQYKSAIDHILLVKEK